MFWKIVAICGIVALVITAAVFGTFMALRPKPIVGFTIESKPYYIKEMRNGLFRYPDVNGMSPLTQPVIALQTKDQSTCEFNNDFTRFTITFRPGVTAKDSGYGRDTLIMYFIVTSYKVGKRGTTATVQQVYNGDLRTYYVTTSPNFIIFTSVANYRADVASDDFGRPPEENIYRENAVVLGFSREDPLYKGVY